MRVPRQQALGYGLTGGLAALADIGIFWVMAPRMPALAAAALSFMAAAVLNYRLSSHWVFQRDWRHRAQALRFGLCALAGLGINAGVTAWLAATLGPLAAKVCGIGTAFGVNYAMNARWVFGRQRSRDVRPRGDTPGPQ